MPILRCRDINVYYEIAGAGDPLLFIHGLGASHRDWEPQVAFFSRHYQVITYDVRGHGKSDKPKGPYRVSQFAADAGIDAILGYCAGPYSGPIDGRYDRLSIGPR